MSRAIARTCFGKFTQHVFDQWASRLFQPVRLIGMAARSLQAGAAQLSLFDDPAARRSERLDRTVDAIVNRFGSKAVRRGM
jgi:hypothetical protein